MLIRFLPGLFRPGAAQSTDAITANRTQGTAGVVDTISARLRHLVAYSTAAWFGAGLTSTRWITYLDAIAEDPVVAGGAYGNIPTTNHWVTEIQCANEGVVADRIVRLNNAPGQRTNIDRAKDAIEAIREVIAGICLLVAFVKRAALLVVTRIDTGLAIEVRVASFGTVTELAVIAPAVNGCMLTLILRVTPISRAIDSVVAMGNPWTCVVILVAPIVRTFIAVDTRIYTDVTAGFIGTRLRVANLIAVAELVVRARRVVGCMLALIRLLVAPIIRAEKAVATVARGVVNTLAVRTTSVGVRTEEPIVAVGVRLAVALTRLFRTGQRETWVVTREASHLHITRFWAIAIKTIVAALVHRKVGANPVAH